MTKEYFYDTASDLGRDQLDHLEALLDVPTRQILEATGVGAGRRCLDLGAGGGTVSRWLAERVRPHGTVVSVDLDIDHLVDSPGVETLRHDVHDGPPPGGPFDLVHARLLLMHLARREEILAELIDALAPGGWLVIGDYHCPRLRALRASSTADMALFDRVQQVTHDVASGGGISPEWAREIDGHLVRADLADIHVVEHSHVAVGGDHGCLLHRNYNLQLEPHLLNAGLTPAELRAYRELMLDPAFQTWFYRFVCVRGRKPLDCPHPVE